MLRNWQVEVQYDGGAYQGWQIQPDFPSVQQEIQQTLSQIYNAECRVEGSGRTDAGVHALGQVFSFKEPREIKLDKDRFKLALNSLLNPDIRVVSAKVCKNDFHARFSAVGKTYIYLMETSLRCNPFWRNFSWNRRKNLDTEKMEQAISLFEGEHDFSAFTVQNKMLKGSAVRNIFKTELTVEGSFIYMRFTGSGFLYKMVRSMAGQTVEAGLKQADPSKVTELLKTGSRLKAARTAPPQGLYLTEVYYDKEILNKRLKIGAADIFKKRFFF